MNDMAVPVPSVFNSELVKKNATAADPWGLNWTRNNTAGGGAFKVESWKPGQEIIYARNDDWKSGPLPKLKRVIQRDVPNAGNRRALLVKGDQAWLAGRSGLPDLAGLTWGRFLWHNLVPVTLGNLAGGTLLVGAVYWFVYLRPRNPV